MKLHYLITFIICFSFVSCEPQSSGYDNLDVLYADFVVHLKGSDEELKKYCFDITPDTGSYVYMKKHNFSYRGIPEKLAEHNVPLSLIGEKYYEIIHSFKETLVRRDQLSGLEYIGRVQQGEEALSEESDVQFTETFIMLKSSNDTIRCKLGEMLCIDGKWKSFTTPKLDW